jgi:capsular exopolysaccharide synthesis family protein
MMQNQYSETRYKQTSTQRTKAGTVPVGTSYSLRDYIRIVLARKWIVLFIFLASVGATFYYLKTATPVYQTHVLIMREEMEQLPASILELGPFAPKESLKSHTALLKSSSSVAEIKDSLKDKYHLYVTVPQIIDHFSLAYDENDSSIIKITATASIPEQAQALANVVSELYVQKVAEMKSANLDKGVSFLEQHVESLDNKLQKAEEALSKFKEKEGLLALPQTTGWHGGTAPTTTSGSISSGLLTKLGEMYSELSKTETDIEWISAQEKSVQTLISEKRKSSLSAFTTPLSPQIDQIQSKLVDLRLQRDTLLEQFTEKDLQVATVQRQIDALQKRLEAEVETLLKKEGQTTLDPLSELQGLVQQSISLSVQKRGMEQKAVILKQKIDKFKEEHPELIAKQVELTRLERQARVFEQTYTTLLDKHEEMLLLKEMKTSGLRMLDQAELPQFPISPKKNRTLIFGFMIGVVLGIGTAFFLEYIDDSIKLKEDVERHLGLPVIGTIPKISPFKVPLSAFSRRALPAEKGNGLSTEKGNGLNGLDNPGNTNSSMSRFAGSRESGPIPLENSELIEDAVEHEDESTPANLQLRRRSRHARGHRKRIKRLLSSVILYADRKNPVIVRYRTLAANIKYANVDTPVQTLLVTSAAPMEGKTSTATNLAISMAQTGSKVLLMDTDLRRPRIHRIFQQDRSPGLAELLTDDLTPPPCPPPLSTKWRGAGGEVIRPTSIDNLYLLPCGAHISTPEGLLSSEKMKKLIELLSEQYDIIIFDSPPLVSSADAMILATQVDGTLMVIRSGETKRQIALQGKELLENVDAHIIGAVLNNIDYSRQYGSYYYYYYYYRSYYYSSDEDES